jgi:hypothetical protein
MARPNCPVAAQIAIPITAPTGAIVFSSLNDKSCCPDDKPAFRVNCSVGAAAWMIHVPTAETMIAAKAVPRIIVGPSVQIIIEMIDTTTIKPADTSSAE